MSPVFEDRPKKRLPFNGPQAIDPAIVSALESGLRELDLPTGYEVLLDRLSGCRETGRPFG